MRWGWTRQDQSCVYYVALLRFIGCTSNASETAALAGGDDIGFNADDGADAGRVAGRGDAVPSCAISARTSPLAVVSAGWRGPSPTRAGNSAACRSTARRPLASVLISGLASDVRLALGHAYERWDGKGYPAGLAGEETPLAVRVVSVSPRRRTLES